MSAAQFKVTGMHCPSCSMLITMALEELPGVESAKVDLATETASVTFDPAQIDPSTIAQAIVKSGYSAELAA